MKKTIALLLAIAMFAAVAAACAGTTNPPAEPTAEPAAEPTAEPEAPVDTAATDKMAADRVAALIDAIYVQERNENTDELCAAAKAAWDALTDAQKELVEGEEADPDYFGRDTGDASKDDPRNADEIGENELLVVSFGTSFNDSRAEDIGGIEAALAAAYPDWSVRRAFTAQIIINHVQARDGEFIDNMDQALERAVKNGVKNLVVQPTHLMQGAEYDELCAAVEAYQDKFETVRIALPLLGTVGKDAAEVNADKETVAKAVVDAAVEDAAFESLAAADEAGIAFVLMGHGTSHNAKVTYTQMQNMMNNLGYKNVFIGTVEGEPEETSCENVIKAVSEAGYKYVILRPLMVVAGDHANNDMADPDDPESWYSMFSASGLFDEIATQIAGLGRIEAVQALYVAHTADAIPNPDKEAADNVAALIDAIYVQERTENTDEQCAAAKAAWDALTDAQKELVEGEEADPDYFGRDTGDASKDDPRNADEIGENELLVVSFGTSFNDSRAEDIGGIEAALAAAYPDWAVRRAFTAQIIINHVQARDGEFIDNMDQALERAVKNGVKNLVVQPTHLMQGAEYDELCAAVEAYKDKFESVKIALPLLGEVGKDAAEVNTDKETVAKAITAEAVKTAGYESLEDAAADGVAFVFMGHGTSHKAKATYTQMQKQMEELGYKNVFIGTVEGEPEETACEAVIEAVHAAGYDKVVLRPLMVVAGDHANNDMADPDDPESWLRQFKDAGLFFTVDVQIAGLGRIADVQALYVAHTAEAMKAE
jgi:cobalamin biosynthesis Co2+ chelatase CbiK